MKKKFIIVVTLVVVLALGGTLVLAAVDEDGNWINPFADILSGKVDEGTITQEEADTFSKVFEAIKGDIEDGKRGLVDKKACRPDGLEGRPEIDSEFMKEYMTVLKEKSYEVKNSLFEEGIIDKDSDKESPKDLDKETIEAVKEAMATVKDYMAEYVESKVADGTITREEADILLNMGMKRPMAPGAGMKGRMGKGMPPGFEKPDESEDDSGA